MASIFKRGGSKNRGGCYTIQYVDCNGRRCTKSSGTTDRAAAQRIAAKLETDVALRRAGVIDHKQETLALEGRKSFAEHLTLYRHKLEASHRSAAYVDEAIKTIERLGELCEYRTLADINPDRLNSYAAQLRTDGLASRTIGKHITFVKSFTKSLVATGKLPFDPLATVRKPSAKGDRRHERRMLLREEWEVLRDSMLTENLIRYNVPAGERVLLYSTAILTGLRSNELRSLTRSNLHFDGPVPFVTCSASSTKNGKAARQYIHRDVADQLLALTASKPPKSPVFRMPHKSHVANMLRADLAAARAAWLERVEQGSTEREDRESSDFLTAVNHGGESLDFHSLRHSCGAWLAMTGAHPNAVKAVMRHSTIVLTMDSYGHLFPGQEADTIARVPSLMPASPPCAAPALHSGRELGQSDSTACNTVRDTQAAPQTSPELLFAGIREHSSSDKVDATVSVRHASESLARIDSPIAAGNIKRQCLTRLMSSSDERLSCPFGMCRSCPTGS